MSGSVDSKTVERILGADIWSKPAVKGGIYLAGPMGNRRQIDAIAKLLPVPVVSTWHTKPPPDLPSPEYLAAAARQNHADLATATAVVAVVHRGQPLETWVEFGAALARGIPVLVFYPVGTLDALPISVRTVDREPVTWCAQGETDWIAKWIGAWYGAL
jgi:nucleoside 2-deoxyribosyltransferase